MAITIYDTELDKVLFSCPRETNYMINNKQLEVYDTLDCKLIRIQEISVITNL